MQTRAHLAETPAASPTHRRSLPDIPVYAGIPLLRRLVRLVVLTFACLAFASTGAHAQLYDENLGPIVVLTDKDGNIDNDDGSNGPIDLPFAVNIFGTKYTQFWINNNGNVTFDAALPEYTPFAFPNDLGHIIVAPFFADADTRPDGASKVHLRMTATEIVVTWDGVGYYEQHTDKRNRFQLILTSDGLAGFSYDYLQWTTGDSSGGFQGFGGSNAVAGFDAGDNVNAVVAWKGNSATDLATIAHKTFWYSITGDPNPDLLPPDTTITGSIDEGAVVTSLPLVFTWTGSDDVTPVDRLVYAWRIDQGAWSPFALDITHTFTTLADGDHLFEVKARDLTGKEDPTPAFRHFHVDTTPPVISNIVATPSLTSCVITWKTDKTATSQVDYGTTNAYGSSTTLDSALVTQHSVTISGLVSNVTYHFRVRSKDAYGVEAVSGDGTIATAAPDLQITTAASSPTTVFTDAAFDVSWTDANLGLATAVAPWKDRVYFSTDNTLGGDLLLGEYPLGQSLAAGVSVNRIQTVSIPRSAVATDGVYYLIVVTDATNTVDEGSNENNNTFVFPITVKRTPFPDLTVNSITAPDSALFGQTITVKWQVKNIGNGSTNSSEWHDKLYLSTDQSPSADDAWKIAVDNVSYLDAGEGYTASADVTIPRGLVGTYYIIVVTDSDNSVVEDNESNNSNYRPITLTAPPLPDLQTTLVQAPSTGLAGEPIPINWKVENKGDAATPPGQTDWEDGIYVSQQTTFDPAKSRYLGSVPHSGALAAGANYMVQGQSITLPVDVMGDWYVYVYTDNTDRVYEFLNENNNVGRSGKITITATPPDLVVKIDDAPAQIEASQPFTVKWTVTNQGAYKARAGWWDTVYLSTNATFDLSTASVLGSTYRDTDLGPGLTYQQSQTFTLPIGTQGNYYLFVYTDSRNQVFEFAPGYDAEANNVSAARAVTVVSHPPDLTVSGVSGPATAEAGKTIPVTWTVTNNGTGPASNGGATSWVDRVYLSKTQTLDGSALQMGSATHSGDLAAGANYTVNANVTVPTAAQGTYYILVKTDADNAVNELNHEDNNVGTSAATISIAVNPPDLTVSGVTTPATADAGKKIQISWTVSNNGTGPTSNGGATAWVDRAYLSKKQTLDGSALQMGGTAHSGDLAPGGSYSVNATLSVPTVAYGTYYVLVKTDADNAVNEGSHEDNNVGVSSITVQVANDNPPPPPPDLTIQSIDAPSEVYPTDIVTVKWVGANGGPGVATPAWNDVVYISKNPTLDGSAQIIASALVLGPVASGGSYQGQSTVTIPILAAGSYYIIVKADGTNNIDEGANEGNNTLSVGITVKAPDNDLQVTALDVPSTAYSGQQMTVSWTVQNSGSTRTAVAAWTDYVILSRDKVLDPTDRVIGWATHTGKLDAGASYTQHVNASNPPGLTGDYYVFVVTDWFNNVPETNENNNVGGPAQVTLQLPPPVDLTPTAITFPANGSPGEPAHLTWTVKNIGKNAAIGKWTDAIYLSKNPVWDIDAAVIARVPQAGPLAAGASYTPDITVDLPPVDPGPYYLIVRTDVRNQVREEDETNNSFTTAGRMSVDVVELQLGVPFNTTLTTGKERHQKVNSPAGETLNYTLQSNDPNSSTELYARFGGIASRSAYDFQFGRPWEPNQQIVVPNTNAGYYYSLIRGALMPAGSTPVAVTAAIVPFSINSVTPLRIGDKGQVTITLHGAKYTNATKVTLKQIGGSGATFTPALVWAVDSATLKARFFMSIIKGQRGDYTVSATNGATTVTAAAPITIEAARGQVCQVSVAGSLKPRAHRPYQAPVDAKNLSNVDLIYVDVAARFSRPVKMGWSRPDSSLPVQSAYPLEDWRYNSPTAFMDETGATTDILTLRNVEPGQVVPLSLNIEDMPEGPFNLQLAALVRSSDAFVHGRRQGYEAMRQAFVSQPNLAVPSDLAPYLAFDEAWYRQFEGDLIQGGYLDAASPNGSGLPLGSLSDAIYRAGLRETLKLAQATHDNDSAGAHWSRVRAGNLAAAADISQLTVVGPDGQWTNLSPGYALGRGVGSNPVDPNGVRGPPPSSPVGGFNGVQQAWNYSVEFENLPTATATVQKVVVTTQLDPNLDWRTFRFAEIGIGKVRIPVPQNQAFVLARFPMGDSQPGVLCDIVGGLDIATGQVQVTLTATDSQTGEQPNSALLGLLPPEDGTGAGKGYVRYSIFPSSSAPTGTRIGAAASITFDSQPPIVTDTIFNTVDAGIPTSKVDDLPADSPTTFLVSWTGADDPNGSGLASFDIWVSDNDDPYQLLIAGTTAASASFTGAQGHTYRFYSIARDLAGNVEAPPDAPDAITSIGNPATVLTVPDVGLVVGQTGNLTAILTAGGVGVGNETITIKLDGTTIGTAVTDATGTAAVSYTPPDGSVGSHTIAAHFDGDGTYQGSDGTGKLAVSIANTALAVDSFVSYPGGIVPLRAKLTRTVDGSGVAGRSVTFKVGTTTLPAATTDAFGVATKSYTVPATTHTGTSLDINGAFGGDANYNASSGAGNITVKKKTSLVVMNVAGTVNTTVNLKATLKAGTIPINGATITFKVDGVSVGTALTAATGIALLSHRITETPSVHVLTAEFAGDTVNAPVVSANGTLTAKGIATILTVTSVVAPPGSTVNLKATLKSGPTVLSGKTVEFLIDGVSQGTAVTNSLGVATLAHTVTESVGLPPHTLTAKFAGDTAYAASTATGTLTVKKTDTKTTPSPVVAKSGATVTLKCTLKAGSVAIAGATITFKIDDVVIGTGTTDNTGLATLSHKITETVGVHTIKCEYAGSTTYNPSTGTANLTVQ